MLEEKAQRKQAGALRAARILIIEDNPQIAELLGDILAAPRYALSFASDGQRGLSYALAQTPDLILLDLNLPDISGWQVLELLRQRGCESVVILVTAHGSENVAVQALRMGVRDYVSKPFTIDEMLMAVERALEEARLRHERQQLTDKLRETNLALQQRMRELSIYQAIGRSVASLMTTDQLLQRITDAVAYLTEAQMVGVFLPDENTSKLSLVAFRRDMAAAGELQTETLEIGVQNAMRSGETAWVRPSPSDNPSSSDTAATGVSLYVPIKMGQDVAGVIVATFGRGRRPNLEVQDRLAVLSNYAAIALKNARLYESTRQEARRLAALTRIAQMVTCSLKLDQVMQALVRSINQILTVQAGSLVLLDQNSGELVFQINLQGDREQLSAFRLRMGQGIVGWVVQNGQSARVNDAASDPRFYPVIDQTIDFSTRSVLCVPLTVPGKTIGAIQVINKIDESAADGIGSFTEQDESLLQAAAAFVAMAIENARLHEALRQTVATQTIQEVVITLSHHINNPLQTILGIASSLKNRLDDPEIPIIIEDQVSRIAAVIDILQNIASPQSTFYLDSMQMIDIEREIAARQHQRARPS